MSGKGTRRNSRVTAPKNLLGTVGFPKRVSASEGARTARSLGLVDVQKFLRLPPSQQSAVAAYTATVRQAEEEDKARRKAAAATRRLAAPGSAVSTSAPVALDDAETVMTTGEDSAAGQMVPGDDEGWNIAASSSSPGVAAPPPPAAGPDNDDQVRGITDREHITWLLFRALARGDFKHDFGENVSSRDKFVKEDENRFFEIAKRVSKKGSVELRVKFKSYINTNLFNLVTDRIDTILPEGDPDKIEEGPAEGTEADIHTRGVAPGEFAKEDEILNLIGLDWGKMKEAIKAQEPGYTFEETFAKSIVPNGRKYEIRACPYRLGDRGSPGYETNTAPIDSLAVVTGGKRDAAGNVTGGKKEFALIVDASGGLPLSELRYRDLIKGAGGGKVYIIENIENGADSATKLLPPALKPKEARPDLRPPPDLKFLRDNVNTINYPLWQAADDQKSNIYSSLFIILNRISEDNVEANLILKDGAGNTVESHSIGDIANASNVKNASLYALAVMLEKGRITNEVLVYTLIKRMGDWCQALSLLDLDREYTIYEADRTLSGGGGQTGGATTTTLRQLQATTEIGVVTNDRILLALCILLGLNVFYTSAMDIARLIYFKNTRDLPSGPALAAVVADLIATINRAAVDGIQTRIAEHEAAILAARDAFIAERILGTNDIADYILALRSLLSNLGRLRLDFTQSVAQIAANYDIVYPPVDVAAASSSSESKRLTAANVIISVMSKIDLDINYNLSVLADLANPANPIVDGKERIRLAALKQKLALGIRIPKSVEVTEAKAILSETRNDIRQILGKQPSLVIGTGGNPLLRTDIFRTTLDDFPGSAASRGATNYTELLSAFPAIVILLPAPAGGQRGGAIEHVANGYAALRTRSVRVLPPLPSTSSASLPIDLGSEEMSAPVAAPVPADNEVTSTINIHRIGAFYYDEALNPYTVADEYIVTKDDLPVFGMVFDGLLVPQAPGTDGPSQGLVYICNRYLLLLLDIAWNDLDGMSQEAAEGGEPSDGVMDPDEKALVEYSGLFEPGTPARTRINQIIEIVSRIKETLAAGASGGNIVNLVNGTVGLYLTPPTGEETIPVDGLRAIQHDILECRNQLIGYIGAYVVAADREIEEGGTVQIETNTATNYSKVDSIAGATYTRYVEPITQQVLAGLWRLTREDAPTLAPGLGEVIRSTIVNAVANVAGAAQDVVIDERYVLGGLLEDFVDDMVAAIKDWTLATVPPQNPTEWGRFEDMLYAVRISLNFIRNGEKRALQSVSAPTRFQAAPQLPSNASAFSFSGRGGRRGLYAGLRKRTGSGSNPDV